MAPGGGASRGLLLQGVAGASGRGYALTATPGCARPAPGLHALEEIQDFALGVDGPAVQGIAVELSTIDPVSDFPLAGVARHRADGPTGQEPIRAAHHTFDARLGLSEPVGGQRQRATPL